MSYAEDRASAAEMLAEDGQTMTLAYVGTSVYDPATGETTLTTPDPQTVKGAILPMSPFAKSVGNIVEGSQQCLLAAENTAGTAIAEPEVNGTITDANGDEWTITAVEPLAPAGLAIMHDCVVRRAA